MSVKTFERRVAALEEGAAKVRVSDEEREEFKKFRAGVLDCLCDVCRAKVEETERNAPAGACQPSQGRHTRPKEEGDFQYGLVRAGICPPCMDRLRAYLNDLVEVRNHE